MQYSPGGPLAQQPWQAEKELTEKIRDRSARVGVIGLGETGLRLVLEMAKEGFQVTGIDIDRRKVDSVNAGISYVPEVPSEAILSLVAKEKIKATQSLAAVENLDTVNICVPIPLGETKEPDFSYVIAAVEAVHNHLRREQLIILVSATYPGITRRVVLPILEESGFQVGRDFFLAYSPERVDRGSPTCAAWNTPQVIGGMTPLCTELAALLYQQFIEKVVPVSSPESAEMVNLLESSFCSVNVALANEMALVCHKLGIDVSEVIEAAKTKPFGFMAFYPEPCPRGHSTPVNPYYLMSRGKMDGFEPRLIELAAQINSNMPAFTVSRIADALNERQKSLKGSKILVLGVAHNRDTGDIHESAAIEVLRGLYEKGSLVYYSDPSVPSIKLNGKVIESVDLIPEVLRSMDCVVMLTDRASFDYATVAIHSPLILDTQNVFKDSPVSPALPASDSSKALLL